MAKGANKLPKRPEDICADTMEVITYLQVIEETLTKQKIKEVSDYTDKIGEEMKEKVDSMSDVELRAFDKSVEAQKAADKAHEVFPDVHRDYLHNNFHYTMNGVNQKVEKRRKRLAAFPNTPHPKAAQPSASLLESESEESSGKEAEKTVIAMIHTPPTSQSAHAPSSAALNVKQYSDSATQTEHHGTYCVQGCLADGKQGNLEMVRCNMCMTWCHQVCCDSDDEFKYEAAWCCPRCRRMPDEISAIKHQLSLVVEALMHVQRHGTIPAAASNLSDVHVDTTDAAAANSCDDVHFDTTDDETQSSSSVAGSESDSGPPPNQEAWQKLKKKKLTKTRRKTPRESGDAEVSHSDNEVSDDAHGTHLSEENMSNESVSELLRNSDVDEDGFTTVRRHSKSPKQTPVASYTVTVIADSIPKHLNKDYILRKTSANVDIKHEGMDISSTVNFIQDNAESLRSQPIIIHTGTNHVMREGSAVTEKRLQRLETNLVFHKYSKVAFSSIVQRNSTPRTYQNIKHVNEMIQLMCLKHGWSYIDNDYIDSKCICYDSVHLNGMGDELLTYSFARCIGSLGQHENH